ncbi:hypothetical protein [Roseobacter sp. CCS2]|uniref:hypothetical protein n=1 Tax=Roseobacter sp. CCS2 TaxID=391593 RepID=UPI00055D7BA5|nr:hypothetical protein [Roseobacter sp. CCS2]
MLLIKAEFERYLDEQRLVKLAFHHRRLDDHTPLAEAHMQRFVPLLELLGVEEVVSNPLLRYLDEIERLEKVEGFLGAIKLTVDFSLQLSELRKRLKRKFAQNPSALTLPYKTERLISEDLVKHCREVMWVINEFHVESNDEGDDDGDALWDVNIWTVILDADQLHREHGRVHSAFYNYLSQYQSQKGTGSPRVYLRTAMTVLLAEFFEEFDRKKRASQIHDKSKSADTDLNGRTIENRVSEYDSAFANLLIEFVQITQFLPVPNKSDNSLDHYRTILRLRVKKQIPHISKYLKSSLSGAEAFELFEIFDQLKF